MESIQVMASLTAHVMVFGIGIMALEGCVVIGLALCVLPVAIGALVCALTPACREAARHLAERLYGLGSENPLPGDAFCWLFEPECDWIENIPNCDENTGRTTDNYPRSPSCGLAKYCARPNHGHECKIADEIYDEAIKKVGDIFGCGDDERGQRPCDQLDDSDRFRHCLGAGLMALQLGAEVAKTLTDLYEEHPDNIPDEKQYDLDSNERGIQLAQESGGASDAEDQLVAACLDYARSSGG